jgi:hypothetical protein
MGGREEEGPEMVAAGVVNDWVGVVEFEYGAAIDALPLPTPAAAREMMEEIVVMGREGLVLLFLWWWWLFAVEDEEVRGDHEERE